MREKNHMSWTYRCEGNPPWETPGGSRPNQLINIRGREQQLWPSWAPPYDLNMNHLKARESHNGIDPYGR